jgi:hypothetical protein
MSEELSKSEQSLLMYKPSIDSKILSSSDDYLSDDLLKFNSDQTPKFPGGI